MNAFSINSEEIANLLVESRLNGIEISVLLMDREFFSADVIKKLIKIKQKFIVPCKNTPRIKMALKEYEKNERGAVSAYSFEDDGESVNFTIVILPKAKPFSERPEDRYMAFATNLQDALWNILNVPEEYRKRWGI